TYTSFDMVRPSAMGRSISVCWNFSVANTDRMDTISGWLFGTSMPIVPLPGMGAMMRIPNAAKLRAMSSSRFFIFEMRTPGLGMISYSVTVGPMVALILDISIL